MNIKINKGRAVGTVNAPPSKSDSHRAIICAFLSRNPCRIDNIEYSKDILATLGALEALGARFKKGENYVTLISVSDTPLDVLDCNESGSSLRFLIPVCLMSGRKITLIGAKRLFARSLDIYRDLCDDNGFLFELFEDRLVVCGKLKPGNYKLRADVSSQFISGLMFVLPCLEGDSTIELCGKTESMPYIELTAHVLSKFNVNVNICDNMIKIKGNQRYSAELYTVEGDWSNAAFFDALNLLGGSVNVCGLNENSVQGDKIYRQYFKQIENGAPTLDVSNCPDLAPVLMALMAAKNGGTLTGTRRLKIKESDRGAAMACELEKFGVPVCVGEDSITVGHTIHAPTLPLCSHNDHRIVMSLALLCTKTGGIIEGAQAVQKSFPDFFEKLSGLNIVIEKEQTHEA